MKSILSNSAVLAASRCMGFVAVIALAALPAVGAGSAKQAVQKDSDSSITLYNIDVGKEIPVCRCGEPRDRGLAVVWRLPGTKEGAEEINQSFNQIDQHEKEIAH
jgi:hypothetical protein